MSCREWPVSSWVISMLVLSVGCGHSVSTTDASDSETADGDATLRQDIAPERADVGDVVDAARDGADAFDSGQLLDIESVDVPDPVLPCNGGRCDPPEGGLLVPGINRSCAGDAGAPPEHCREVWAGGGMFTMGSLEARKSINNGNFFPQTACDIAQGYVHPAYIDAYPVSVARFRAWVLAGRPQPAIGSRVFLDSVWTDFDDRGVRRSIQTDTEGPFAAPWCTYRATPGEHDDLPITCITWGQAMAFCHWDGKHMETEAMVEWIATNGGRTTYPFVPPANWNPCDYGDVSWQCRPGQPEVPSAITAFPNAQSVDPAGIFGLWASGAPLLTLPVRDACTHRFTDQWGGRASEWHVRGLNPFRRIEDAGLRGQGHPRSFEENGNFVREYAPFGVRCMRWLPEPRG